MKKSLMLFVTAIIVNLAVAQKMVNNNRVSVKKDVNTLIAEQKLDSTRRVISKDNRVYTNAEIPAVYKNGERDWALFLSINTKSNLPQKANVRPGRYQVMVRFVIEKDGRLSNIVCEDNPGMGICEEVKRVIQLSKKWKPATVLGVPVKSTRRQLFTFELE